MGKELVAVAFGEDVKEAEADGVEITVAVGLESRPGVLVTETAGTGLGVNEGSGIDVTAVVAVAVGVAVSLGWDVAVNSGVIGVLVGEMEVLVTDGLVVAVDVAVLDDTGDSVAVTLGTCVAVEEGVKATVEVTV